MTPDKQKAWQMYVKGRRYERFNSTRAHYDSSDSVDALRSITGWLMYGAERFYGEVSCGLGIIHAFIHACMSRSYL